MEVNSGNSSVQALDFECTVDVNERPLIWPDRKGHAYCIQAERRLRKLMKDYKAHAYWLWTDRKLYLQLPAMCDIHVNIFHNVLLP